MALERSVSLPVAVSDSQSAKSSRFSKESNRLMCFFPTKNEFSLKIPEMLVSRVVFAESEGALLSVLWRKLYCVWFSFYIK